MEKRKEIRREEDKNYKKVMVLGFSFVKDNKELHNNLQTILFEKGLEGEATIEHNVELLEFLKHGVVLAPGVVVDGKLKSVGRVPNKEEMIEWLDELEKEIEKDKGLIEDMDEESFEKELENSDLVL